MRGLSVPGDADDARRVSTAMTPRWTRRGQARPRQGPQTAGRRGLPAGLRGAAALPEQPLRQRRAGLPGGGLDVGQGGRQGAPDRPAVRHAQPDLPAHASRRSSCWAGVCRPTTRCTRCRPGATRRTQGADGNFNFGKAQRRNAGWPDPEDQVRTRRAQTQRADQGGAAAHPRRILVRSHPSPDPTLGDEAGRWTRIHRSNDYFEARYTTVK